MTAVVRHFGDRQRERLVRLFRQLGTHNIHERQAARNRIDALLREYDKTWSDLIGLLGGKPAAIGADLTRHIAALGASDPDARLGFARSAIDDLLARHRKNWNDLAVMRALR